MLPLRNQLDREVSALYGFVDSISASCAHLPQSVAFTESSARFFRYIEQLAVATKRHLARFPSANLEGAAEDEFHEIRGELSLFGGSGNSYTNSSSLQVTQTR